LKQLRQSFHERIQIAKANFGRGKIAMEDVGNASRNDFARIVIGKRILQARVPFPFPNLAQVEQLQIDAIGKNLRIDLLFEW
jgi:hypothetical protein